jgi:hypothetical protein
MSIKQSKFHLKMIISITIKKLKKESNSIMNNNFKKFLVFKKMKKKLTKLLFNKKNKLRKYKEMKI